MPTWYPFSPKITHIQYVGWDEREFRDGFSGPDRGTESPCVVGLGDKTITIIIAI